MFMPAAKSGKAYKLARPFHGPYRVVCVVENGFEVRPVDQPHVTPIRVALNQICQCPDEMPNSFWPTRGVSAQSMGPSVSMREETEPQRFGFAFGFAFGYVKMKLPSLGPSV